MAEPISPDDVQRLARLARLAIDDDACADIAGRLTRVIDHMDCLRTLDLEGVAPMAHVSFKEGIDETRLRDDEPGETLPPGLIAAMAPQAHEEAHEQAQEAPTETDADVFFSVPKVIGGGSS
ncbi:MAG: Asp-tRNA(Asn)/Glu-tRNA(Gln) amidotransferase subunit GatC [Planctomycetota bacterium]